MNYWHLFMGTLIGALGGTLVATCILLLSGKKVHWWEVLIVLLGSWLVAFVVTVAIERWHHDNGA